MESIAAAINKSSNAAQSLSHNDGMKQRVSCPVTTYYETACMHTNPLKYIIIHLNDEHKWSREDIADWLDTLENQPVFYPDVRSDDEKIEDAQKLKHQHTSLSDIIDTMNDVAEQYMISVSKSFGSTFLSGFPNTYVQSGPIVYQEASKICALPECPLLAIETNNYCGKHFNKAKNLAGLNKPKEFKYKGGIDVVTNAAIKPGHTWLTPLDANGNPTGTDWQWVGYTG